MVREAWLAAVHGVTKIQTRLSDWTELNLIQVIPEWSSGFPYFLQLGNKEFMIWATVSSRSYFCWVYRASPSLAAKNIITLISVLTVWWCPSIELFLVCWKRVFAMTSAFSWQNSISLCPASFCTPWPNLSVIPGISWLPILHSSPLWWKGQFLGC